MNILEFTRSTHVRNKIVVGNYHVVQLVVNFGISTMLYVPVVARVDNLTVTVHAASRHRAAILAKFNKLRVH